jgi:prepilin-type processing-associated H-X9-DG protein
MIGKTMEINLLNGRRNFRQLKKLPASERAFSRIDLLAVIFTVLLLGGWVTMTHYGESGRMARCVGNLAALGKAMHGYANDNGGALPAGGINLGKTQASWDLKLYPYLEPGLAKANSDQLFDTAPRFYFCPSDKAPRKKKNTPRSYAMAGNDMSPQHWPPGPDSPTGVGLWWDKQTVLALLDEDALQKPELLPVVKLSDVSAPADTLLLTEFIDPNNTMGSIQQTTVLGTSQQMQFFKHGDPQFHHGKFNYLMVDGHVEALSPLQTGSFDGSAGIWSIKKRD